MGNSKKPRAGKDFELLVARIEEMLAPIGAIVKSPDYIRDLVTGHMREVDASIQVPDGDTTRLITVECRDHTRGRQDDRWIEQLITKREKLGAWKTIAVSSSGFSESAITTAHSYGIEIRKFDQISDAEIVREWIGDFTMTLLSMEFNVLGMTIIDIDGNIVAGDSLLPALSKALEQNLLETPFLHIKDKDLVLSTSDIVHIVRQPEGLTEGGPPIRATVSLRPNDKTYYVEVSIWRINRFSGSRRSRV